MMHVRQGVLPILLGAALCVAAAAPDAGGLDPADLKLRVSTHHGFIPLELKLEGDLAGLKLEGPAACLISVEYRYKTPGGSHLQSKEEFPCTGTEGAARAEDAVLPRTFTKVVTIREPGDYSYRIIVEPQDGRRVAGTTQDVRVFRSKLEVGVTATTTDD